MGHIDSRALAYFKKMADAVLNVLICPYKDYLSLSEEELKALHTKKVTHSSSYTI